MGSVNLAEEETGFGLCVMESPRRVSNKRYTMRGMKAAGMTLLWEMGLGVGKEQREAVGYVGSRRQCWSTGGGEKEGIFRKYTGREASRISGEPECGR